MSINAPVTLDIPSIDQLRIGQDVKEWLREFSALLQQLFEMIAADVEIIAPPGGGLMEHELVGASHTAAALTVGHVLRASAAAVFSFAQLQHTDLGGLGVNDHHNQAHNIEGTDHTGAGLTIGEVLRASAAAAFSFDRLQTDDLPDNIRVDGGAYYDTEFDNGNSGAADTIDWTVGNKQKTTLTDNCTFTFTAPTGPCNVVLKVVQGGAGSFAPVWPDTVKWPAGVEPYWSVAVGAVDIIAFYFDGTNYYGQASINFLPKVANLFWRFVQTTSALTLQSKVAGVWTKVAEWQY